MIVKKYFALIVVFVMSMSISGCSIMPGITPDIIAKKYMESLFDEQFTVEYSTTGMLLDFKVFYMHPTDKPEELFKLGYYYDSESKTLITENSRVLAHIQHQINTDVNTHIKQHLKDTDIITTKISGLNKSNLPKTALTQDPYETLHDPEDYSGTTIWVFTLETPRSQTERERIYTIWKTIQNLPVQNLTLAIYYMDTITNTTTKRITDARTPGEDWGTDLPGFSGDRIVITNTDEIHTPEDIQYYEQNTTP